MASGSRSPVTAAQVLCYYPNLIGELVATLWLSSSLAAGYARIAFMIGSFYFALSNWQVTLVLYLLAFGGDAVDGHVARAFKQSEQSFARHYLLYDLTRSRRLQVRWSFGHGNRSCVHLWVPVHALTPLPRLEVHLRHADLHRHLQPLVPRQ
jgi:hypothetical protein